MSSGSDKGTGTGRCSGCGKQGKENLIKRHLPACEQYAKLYREDPWKALNPVEEYERWLTEEEPGVKAEKHRVVVADTDARRAAMAVRFKTRDPLED